MVKELPKFKGYTVDERLREFRKVEYGKSIEFVPFGSPKGQELLKEMRAKKWFDVTITGDISTTFQAEDKSEALELALEYMRELGLKNTKVTDIHEIRS